MRARARARSRSSPPRASSGPSVRRRAAWRAVASATIDFEKDRKLNVAVVEYDADVVDAEVLVAKVTAIGDGMYPVHRMAVTHHGEAAMAP